MNPTPEQFHAMVELERASSAGMATISQTWLILCCIMAALGILGFIFGSLPMYRKSIVRDVCGAVAIISAALGTVVAVTLVDYTVRRDHPEAFVLRQLRQAEQLKQVNR